MMTLPPAIAAYFKSAHDLPPEQLAAIFAEDAQVHDEKQDYHGLDTIRQWRIAAYAATQFAARPLALREEGAEFLVTAEVSGTFPGSPIMLAHRFVLKDGRITDLEIG